MMLTSDTYKYSHWKQYPPGTEYVYSYMESRCGEFCDDMVVAGIQVVLEDIAYLASVHEPLVMRKAFFAKHFGSDKIYNEKGFERLWEKYHGRLPVVIKALPEGTVVRKHNVFLTIENTDPEFPWLTNYLETLLMHAWYTCTVATKSRDMKKLLLHYLKKSGDESLIDFKLHDFGFRGASSDVTAGRGGLAHLISFKGTDTEIALTTADWHYNEEMAGFSIPAAEHSTITSWGREN